VCQRLEPRRWSTRNSFPPRCSSAAESHPACRKAGGVRRRDHLQAEEQRAKRKERGGALGHRSGRRSGKRPEQRCPPSLPSEPRAGRSAASGRVAAAPAWFALGDFGKIGAAADAAQRGRGRNRGRNDLPARRGTRDRERRDAVLGTRAGEKIGAGEGAQKDAAQKSADLVDSAIETAEKPGKDDDSSDIEE